MGTKYVARLYWEHECPECKGEGYYWERLGKVKCEQCNGTGKVWQQLTRTHAYSYEDALDKLLKRKHIIYGAEFGMFSPVKSYAYEDKFFLVWADEAKTGPIDVTRAVAYRLHNWQAKEIYKRDREC